MSDNTAAQRDHPISSDDVAVSIKDISKIYNDGEEDRTVAIEDISLDIERDSFVSIIGPSGCGKSTLLMIIAGLLEPTGGQVYVDGELVDGPRPETISVVFQEFTLLPWKTALENVGFPRSLRGESRDEWEDRARELLRLVRLSGNEDKYPRELSGGMKQRVAIARSLIQDPALLLMDEPFGALDEQTRMKLGNEVLDIWRRTTETIVFITHDLSEAVYLSDRVVVLNNEGRVEADFTIDLPRPRVPEMMGSEPFGEYRTQLWNIIME